MADNYEFKLAFTLIYGGFRMLMKNIWCWVMYHKAVTALSVSLMINILLLLDVMTARAERDNYNHEALVMEQKVDSLTLLTSK